MRQHHIYRRSERQTEGAHKFTTSWPARLRASTLSWSARWHAGEGGTIPVRGLSGCSRCQSSKGGTHHRTRSRPTSAFAQRARSRPGAKGAVRTVGDTGGRSASASEYWARHVTAAGERERTYGVIVQPRLHLHYSLPELAQIIERPRDGRSHGRDRFLALHAWHAALGGEASDGALH